MTAVDHHKIYLPCVICLDNKSDLISGFTQHAGNSIADGHSFEPYWDQLPWWTDIGFYLFFNRCKMQNNAHNNLISYQYFCCLHGPTGGHSSILLTNLVAFQVYFFRWYMRQVLTICQYQRNPFWFLPFLFILWQQCSVQVVHLLLCFVTILFLVPSVLHMLEDHLLTFHVWIPCFAEQICFTPIPNIVFAYIAHAKFQKASFNNNRDIRQNICGYGDGPQNNTSRHFQKQAGNKNCPRVPKWHLADSCSGHVRAPKSTKIMQGKAAIPSDYFQKPGWRNS